jgi:RIO-like serine/threonine protein kinase
VVSGDDEEVTMGMLVTLITSPDMGSHLQSPGFHDKAELHKKWEEQVDAIVRELHAHDIVWGDVNPMNVVVDEAMDAWVIDFGGMNNIHFVDDEKRETMEGDWQGVGRLFGS